MSLLRLVYDKALDYIKDDFNLTVILVEAKSMRFSQIDRIKWQMGNLIKDYKAKHPVSKLMLLGYSNGSAQIVHSINHVFSQKEFEKYSPDLTILLDPVVQLFSTKPFYLAPFHGKFYSLNGKDGRFFFPIIHGSQVPICMDQDKCELRRVHNSKGKLSLHSEVPENFIKYDEEFLYKMLDDLY